MKKAVSLILSAVLFTCILSSCGYRLVKIEDETTTTQNVLHQPETSTVQETTTLPPPVETTTDPADYTGITVNTDYKSVAMSKEDIVNMYADAVNNVKLRCPGFTKTEYQEISNVSAGNGNIQLANRIMNLVGTELLTSSGDTEATVTVQPYDDIRVREYFPVFGEEYACSISDYSIITSAACYTDGKYYKIVMTVADTLNPEPKTTDFGRIMTPLERKNLANSIAEYVVVLDMSQYQFDINYTGNEITCLIDKETNRLASLSQKMIMLIDIDFNLDLFIFKTTLVQTSGTVINHLEYTDFIW